jgi:hypothetical protein
MQKLFSRFLQSVFTVTALLLSPQLTAFSHTEKPNLSPIDLDKLPAGCSYMLDDWRDNYLLWAPYISESQTNIKNALIIKIDGIIRQIPISGTKDSRSDTITATSDQYTVKINNQTWQEAGYEVAKTKAVIKVVNNETEAQTQLIVRAMEGC